VSRQSDTVAGSISSRNRVMRALSSTCASARVEHLPDPVLGQQDAPELGVAVAERGPLLGRELRGFEECAGVQIGVPRAV
jgi:hypothetical protein